MDRLVSYLSKPGGQTTSQHFHVGCRFAGGKEVKALSNQHYKMLPCTESNQRGPPCNQYKSQLSRPSLYLQQEKTSRSLPLYRAPIERGFITNLAYSILFIIIHAKTGLPRLTEWVIARNKRLNIKIGLKLGTMRIYKEAINELKGLAWGDHISCTMDLHRKKK